MHEFTRTYLLIITKVFCALFYIKRIVYGTPKSVLLDIKTKRDYTIFYKQSKYTAFAYV